MGASTARSPPATCTTRSYETYKREARRQGRAIWLIQHLHGEVLEDWQIRDRMRPLLPLLKATDRPRMYSAVRAALDAGVRLAGRARLFALERKLGSLLGHVERRRGEYEQSVQTPRPEPWRAPAPASAPR